MTGRSPHLPQAPDSPAWKRWVFAAVVVAEAVFVGYLLTQAFRADGDYRPFYLLGAGGLSLLIGGIAWSRLR